jgi:hypothetical protein
MATLKEVAPRLISAQIRRSSWKAGVWIEPLGYQKAVIRSEGQSYPYAFSYEDFTADDWELAQQLGPDHG